MMNDSHYIFDELLRQWHAHCKGYSPIPVAGADPMFRNAKAGRGYDTTAEIIEDELHGSTMETIDFQVDQMQDPWRAAIHELARNLWTQQSVWRHPRLGQLDSLQRATIVAEARNQLTKRLMAAGVM
jgi:hypothetical protein